MGIKFFKPTKSNTGSAMSVSFSSKDECVFLELIKQTSWNTETGNGSFKDGLKVNTKLSLTEVGGILDFIETTLAASVKNDKATLSPASRPFSGYHTTIKGNTRLNFNPYIVKDTGEFKGISLSVKKTTKGETAQELSFLLGLTPGEAVVLREYLKFALGHCFAAIYSADKKRGEQYAKNKANKPQPPEVAEPEPTEAEPEVTPAGEDDFGV